MTPVQTNAEFPPPRWSWRHVPWIGGVFIVVIVAMAAHDLVASHRELVAETGRELGSQARVIAEQTTRSLQTVERVLGHVVDEYRRGVVASKSPAELHAYLKDQAVGLVQLEDLSLVDAQGKVHASSAVFPLPEPLHDIAAGRLFQDMARERPADTVLDKASPALVTRGQWVFRMVRRLETASGGFAGIVAAGGKVEYFQQFYRDMRLDPGTHISLVHRDGSLVARHPPVESALGKRLPLFESLMDARQPGQDVPVRTVGPIDGVDRFVAIEPVPDQPLSVIVTRDAAVALAPWRQQAMGTVIRTLALAILAMFLLDMVRRQFVRLDTVRESLEASRERFALAAAGSDDGIWDWDLVGDRIYASARAREIFGLSPGPDMQSRREWFAHVCIHPDDAPSRREAIQAHLAGRSTTYQGEYRVRGLDGEFHWVRVCGLCVRDAAGHPTRMAGSVSDIDARRRGEDALRLSEERYALAMTGSTGGHWVWDVATDSLFVSGTVNQLFDLPADTQPRTRLDYFSRIQVHGDDLDTLQRINDEVLKGQAARLDFEYRIVLPDGGVRWILSRAQCFRDAQGHAVRVAGVSVDISERKRTEDALRLSEERFALAVAGSDDGVWDFDYRTRKVFGSRRARVILGLPLEPEVQSMEEWFARLELHPDDERARLVAMEEHLSGRAPAYEGEWRVQQPDGGYRWVRVHGMCVRNAQGQPLRMAGSVSDIDARKRAEESLRQSEERYALAVAGSDDGVWDWDFEAGLAFESARAREVQGLPPGPELQPLDTLLESLRAHPQDGPRRAEGLRAHLAGETPAYECEYRVRHDDGRYRWIRVRALCIRDATGKPYRMAGSVSDIDARKRAEEALRLSEERFSLAMAGANDGILDWDIVHDSMYVSERAMRLVGLTREAGTYTRAEWSALVLPRFHSDDTHRLNQELRGDLENPADSHEGEYRVLGADGVFRWVRFRGRSVRDAHGKAIRWAGSVSDVDGLKRAEEALRRSEERYALAVAGSNEGLWDWDLAGDTLFLSARAQEILLLEPGEAQRPRREWIAMARYHPEDRDLVRNAISAHLRGDTPNFRVEYRLQHDSGDWRWYRQRGVAVRNAQGRPTRMAGSMEDITDRKNSEGERERLGAQLRQAQKLEAIGTLAGGIAHDFNNILAAILGYGEMAQRDAPEGTALRRHIDAALSAGMRAKSLVERILAFSRSGMSERVPVNVESVVGEALDVVEASLPPGIVLQRRLATGDAAVLGDSTQVHQVVMNLCANAVQAIGAQGSVSVTLDLMGAGSPHCATSVLADANHIRLQVRDTGVGISPQVLERIFDPFFTTKEVGVGTGLGLSLVHGIVTDLGGGIEVDSQVGEGSTFTVYLPWQSCLAVPPAAEPEAAVPNGNGQTILLVDDEEPLVRLGEEMIAELGYEPVGFTSSLVALERFRAEPHRFNAVLSDEAMPEMTGSELVREILKIRPDIPVVMMSGYVTAALAARARETGVVEVLSKPLASRDIARGLATALQR